MKKKYKCEVEIDYELTQCFCSCMMKKAPDYLNSVQSKTWEDNGFWHDKNCFNYGINNVRGFNDTLTITFPEKPETSLIIKNGERTWKTVENKPNWDSISKSMKIMEDSIHKAKIEDFNQPFDKSKQEKTFTQKLTELAKTVMRRNSDDSNNITEPNWTVKVPTNVEYTIPIVWNSGNPPEYTEKNGINAYVMEGCTEIPKGTIFYSKEALEMMKNWDNEVKEAADREKEYPSYLECSFPIINNEAQETSVLKIVNNGFNPDTFKNIEGIFKEIHFNDIISMNLGPIFSKYTSGIISCEPNLPTHDPIYMKREDSEISLNLESINYTPGTKIDSVKFVDVDPCEPIYITRKENG